MAAARSRRPLLAALAALAAIVAVALAAPAPAQDLAGYDGSNPFNCEIQDVGQGTDFPDPDADPFCVEYDKSEQNVNRLGIVEFLAGEPVRLAAAADKCFYYQRDHWRGSLIEEEEATETYNWNGAYFFDKARGEGGVFAENFSLNNQTVDPTRLPGFPDRYRPFFGEGRGGLMLADGVPIDPRCAERAEDEDVHAGGDGDDSGDRGEAGDDRAGSGRGEDEGAPRGADGDPDRSGGDRAGFEAARRSPRFTG